MGQDGGEKFPEQNGVIDGKSYKLVMMNVSLAEWLFVTHPVPSMCKTSITYSIPHYIIL